MSERVKLLPLTDSEITLIVGALTAMLNALDTEAFSKVFTQEAITARKVETEQLIGRLRKLK